MGSEPYIYECCHGHVLNIHVNAENHTHRSSEWRNVEVLPQKKSSNSSIDFMSFAIFMDD
jgi:hypothetical protein